MGIMTETEKQIEARLSAVIPKLSDSGLEKLVAYAEFLAAVADLMDQKRD